LLEVEVGVEVPEDQRTLTSSDLKDDLDDERAYVVLPRACGYCDDATCSGGAADAL